MAYYDLVSNIMINILKEAQLNKYITQCITLIFCDDYVIQSYVTSVPTSSDSFERDSEGFS